MNSRVFLVVIAIVAIVAIAIVIVIAIAIISRLGGETMEKFDAFSGIFAKKWPSSNITAPGTATGTGKNLAIGVAPKGLAVKILFCIMDLSVIGKAQPSTTTDKIIAFLNTTQPNLAGFLSTCTMGNLTLDYANCAAINVQYPSNPTLNDGTPVSLTTCTNNMENLLYFAGEYAQKHGVNVDAFHCRVLVLPVNYTTIFTGCNFSGLGTQGRWSPPNQASIAAGNSWGYSMLWMGGVSWNDVSTYAHELGHAFGGFHHARSIAPPMIGERNDLTDSMSSWGANDLRCYDAPHMWFAGWSTPYATLSFADLPRTIEIPVQQHTSGPTGVYVGVGDTMGTYYAVSYRINFPNSLYDKPFWSQYNISQALTVHRMPVSAPANDADTQLVALVSTPGTTWIDTVTPFSVTLVSMDSSTATAILSR